jgi:hypothetical protein
VCLLTVFQVDVFEFLKQGVSRMHDVVVADATARDGQRKHLRLAEHVAIGQEMKHRRLQ